MLKILHKWEGNGKAKVRYDCEWLKIQCSTLLKILNRKNNPENDDKC